MIIFFFLLLRVTLWYYGFSTVWKVVNPFNDTLHLLVNICPYYHMLFLAHEFINISMAVKIKINLKKLLNFLISY